MIRINGNIYPGNIIVLNNVRVIINNTKIIISNNKTMDDLNKKEIAQIVEDFLNNTGQWFDFKNYIENKGYKLEELGFEDEN